jgi:hydrogenase expression/formation protein HypD
VNGYLAAGHVCTVMGLGEYEKIAEEFKVPVVATGLEPVDLLEGIYMIVKQLEEGRHAVENQYSRSVRVEGNVKARETVARVFEVVDRNWRGIGLLPASGLQIKDRYAAFDVEKKFSLGDMAVQESSICISGSVLQGLKKPVQCPAFGKECVPENPLGATMVSSEGACAAYYKYNRIREAAH